MPPFLKELLKTTEGSSAHEAPNEKKHIVSLGVDPPVYVLMFLCCFLGGLGVGLGWELNKNRGKEHNLSLEGLTNRWRCFRQICSVCEFNQTSIRNSYLKTSSRLCVA